MQLNISRGGTTHTFDAGQKVSVLNGTLQVLMGPTANAETIAFFAPNTWQWASTTQQQHKQEK